MKKKRNLIILAVAFAVLLGAYFYITYRPKKEVPNASPNKITLWELDSKKVTKMSLVSKTGTILFEKKGDAWECKTDPGIKLDQDSVSSIARCFASPTIDKVIDENPTNTADYGLKPAQITATASFDGSVDKVIYIGERIPGGTGFYMMTKDDPKVYILSAADGNNYVSSIADLRDKKIIPTIKSEDVNYLKVVNSDKRVVELQKNETQTEEEKQYNVSTWYLKQPYSRQLTANMEKVTPIFDSIVGITVSKFIEDNPKDLSKYGLDNPDREVLLKTKDNGIHIYIGKDMDQSYTYFRLEGSNTVYAEDKTKLDSIKVNPFDLVDKFAYIVNIDKVDQITIDGFGKKYAINLSRTTKPAAKSGDKDEVVMTCKVNGSDMEEAKFKKMYQEMIGLMVESENDKKIEEKPEVTFTYTLNSTDEKTIKVEYCTYNADFDAVFVNGKADFLISKSQVQKVMGNIQGYVDNK